MDRNPGIGRFTYSYRVLLLLLLLPPKKNVLDFCFGGRAGGAGEGVAVGVVVAAGGGCAMGEGVVARGGGDVARGVGDVARGGREGTGEETGGDDDG